MFTPIERQNVANDMIAAAQDFEGVEAGAVVGSAAAGTLDGVTGIDLVLAASPDAAVDDVRGLWTREVYARFGAIHHTAEGNGVVYLLPHLLTARVAIVPAALFGPRPGEPFQQEFGPPPAASGPASSGPVDLVGPAWLAALRTRAALHRGDAASAAIALDALREALIALAGARSGSPYGYLPRPDRDRIRTTEPSSRDFSSVATAFGAAVQILDAELQVAAPAVADAVALPLLEEAAG